MDRLTDYMVAALQKPPQPPPKPPIKPVPDWLERIRRGEMKIEQAPAYVPDKGETGGWLQMPPEHLQHLAGDVVRPPLTVFGYPQSQSAEDRWWPKVQAPGGMEAIKSLGGVTNMPPNVLPIRPQSDLGIPQHLAGDVLSMGAMPYVTPPSNAQMTSAHIQAMNPSSNIRVLPLPPVDQLTNIYTQNPYEGGWYGK